jgi:hypothetical protein
MDQQDKVARYGLLVSTASGILGCVLVMYGLAVDIVKEESPTSCSYAGWFVTRNPADGADAYPSVLGNLLRPLRRTDETALPASGL